MSAHIFDNTAWSQATPTISVLIPFLRDDPCGLLQMLDREAAALNGAVEIVLMDDGTADAALTARIIARITAMALPTRLLTLPRNEGRAKGRNRLAASARGAAPCRCSTAAAIAWPCTRRRWPPAC